MDFVTQVGLVVLGLFLVFSPEVLVENVDFGTSPTVTDFLIAIPVGMVAFTGIDTISNMAEEAKDYGKTIPQSMRAVVVAVMTISLTLPMVALSAMPVVDGETTLGLTEEEGGYADNPILGVVENIDLGPLQGAAEIYVGLLAATILLVATNAGLIGRVAADATRWGSTASCRRCCASCIRASARPTWRSSCSGRSPAWRSCPARRRSSGRSTRSGRCCRSRWLTRR